MLELGIWIFHSPRDPSTSAAGGGSCWLYGLFGLRKVVMGTSMAIANTAVIIVTAVVSILAFSRRDLIERLIFDPEYILAGKQYYRLVTAALLHADWWHLGLNLIGLMVFGANVERALGIGPYLLIYAISILGGNLLSLFLHRHHIYRAYGASGGVSGLTFAFVLIAPQASIGFGFMPISMPAWVYAIVYMLVSFWGIRGGTDNIGHDAHLGGAIFGLAGAALLEPELVRESPRFFLLLLIIAGGLLGWLLVNPMGLPVRVFFEDRVPFKKARSERPRHKVEGRQLDAILEKIGKKGIQSLSEEEKQLLDETSGKLRRRSESKKPDSGLAI
jgi:membrane associated rhomboid family serine protease